MHSHHHHPHHHHHHTAVQANRDFFDGDGRKIMSSDDALNAGLSAAEAVREAIQLGPDLELLDFACGPGKLLLRFFALHPLIVHLILGNVSKHLASHCKSILGLDISQALVDDFNANAATLGLSDKMTAKCVDITEHPEALEDKTFDLIFVSRPFACAAHLIELPSVRRRIPSFPITSRYDEGSRQFPQAVRSPCDPRWHYPRES